MIELTYPISNDILTLSILCVAASLILRLVDKNTASWIFLAVAWCCALSIFVLTPTHTVEYQNGYNAYPDNSIYKDAKIISDDSAFISAESFYCDGWEAAQEDTMTDTEKNEKEKQMSVIDREKLKAAMYA